MVSIYFPTLIQGSGDETYVGKSAVVHIKDFRMSYFPCQGKITSRTSKPLRPHQSILGKLRVESHIEVKTGHLLYFKGLDESNHYLKTEFRNRYGRRCHCHSHSRMFVSVKNVGLWLKRNDLKWSEQVNAISAGVCANFEKRFMDEQLAFCWKDVPDNPDDEASSGWSDNTVGSADD